MSSLVALPNELISRSLGFLDLQALARTQSVSKQLNQLGKWLIEWLPALEQQFGELDDTAKKAFEKNAPRLARQLAERHNPTLVKVVRLRTRFVQMVASGDTIYTLTNDKTIRVWDRALNLLEAYTTTHQSDCSVLAINEQLLCSADIEGIIELRSRSDGQIIERISLPTTICENTLAMTTDSIYVCGQSQTSAFLGRLKMTISSWYTKNLYKPAHSCHVDADNLFVGFGDGKAAILSSKTLAARKILDAHLGGDDFGSLGKIATDRDLLYLVSDGVVALYDKATKVCLRVVKELPRFTSSPTALATDQLFFYTEGVGCINVYKRSGTKVSSDRLIRNTWSIVRGIFAFNHHLLVASSNGTLEKWDFAAPPRIKNEPGRGRASH